MRYDVIAKRLELSTLVDIKANRAELIGWLPETLPPLPDLPNTASRLNEINIFWISKEHWLIRALIEQETNLIEQLNLESVPQHISAVLISDTLTFFELSGPDADQIVSIASPLDFHETVFPENGVTYTEVFGLKALLIRTDSGFELAIDRSYADMLEDYLSRAGANFE